MDYISLSDIGLDDRGPAYWPRPRLAFNIYIVKACDYMDHHYKSEIASPVIEQLKKFVQMPEDQSLDASAAERFCAQIEDDRVCWHVQEILKNAHKQALRQLPPASPSAPSL